ncbi:beta-lactamase/transpeptidase-like protein [Flagelloscypha sp. PMI_526]|nr:beta-lactamase/transpeptidase-like protein [Flagelloscypha sp. PMI_526]
MRSLQHLWFFTLSWTAFQHLVSAKVITPEVDAFINKLLSDWHIRFGVSVGVVSRSEDGTWETETAGYGVADLNGTKVTGQTQFSLASDSKHFDAVGAGLVISNTSVHPRISWDTPIKQIFPQFKLMDSKATELATITDLMSHQTGLPTHDLAFNLAMSKDDVFRVLPHLKPSVPFRGEWQYNNFGYTVLSYIPEQLVGIPFGRYLQAELFDKLGMKSTTYSTKQASRSGKFAKGIGLVANEMTDIFGINATTMELPPFNPDSDLDGNDMSGPGGLISTVDDLNIWMKMLLLNGSHPTTNETIVPADVLAKLVSPIIKMDSGLLPPNNYISSTYYYGGGRGLYQYRGEDVQEHGGEAPAMKCTMATLPGRQLAITVLTNGHNGNGLEQVIKFRLIDAFLGVEPADWTSIYLQVAQEAAAAGAQAPVPPSNPTPPYASFKKLEGKYSDPAYGTVELCYVPPNSSVTTTSKSCQKTLARTDPAVLTTPDHKFVIGRENVPVDTHWILSHWDGNLFNLTDAFFSPNLKSGAHNSEYWFLGGFPSGVVEFDVKAGGFGISGGFWQGGLLAAEPNGTSVKDKSEVWFSSHSSH